MTKPKHPRPSHAQSADYRPGYFTELVQKHDWPPQFAPQMPRVKLQDVTRLTRPATHINLPPPRGGWDRNPLALPGAVSYIVHWSTPR